MTAALRYSATTLAALARVDETRQALRAGPVWAWAFSVEWQAHDAALKGLWAALDDDASRRESAMRAAEDEALARLADRTTALAEAMERDRAQPHRHQYGEPL